MTDLKLYESKYRFMDLIWEAEPVRSTELAKMARERLEWKKSTCYTVLKKLEAKGYLVRTEDENDARSKNVRALPPALEIHSQGKGLSEQFFDQVTGDFSTEERELLDQLLGRMLEKGKALAAAPAPEKEVRP